jgi:hypothetical protein
MDLLSKIKSVKQQSEVFQEAISSNKLFHLQLTKENRASWLVKQLQQAT